MLGGRRPLVEDNLQWKKTFGGRRPLVEDNLLWKTTFSGRGPSVEDKLWWKTTFGGRWPSEEENLWLKMPLGGRRPSVEDDLRSKTTFGGGWPVVEKFENWILVNFQPSLRLVSLPLFFTKLRLVLLSHFSVGDNLWWKTTFGGGRSLVEDDLRWTWQCNLVHCMKMSAGAA